MPIRLGVVGLSKNRGWASTNLIPPVFEKPLSEKLELTAVSTSSPESAAASAAHYSNQAKREVKPYSGSTAAISADPDVDVVVVSVKVYEHLEAVMPAIDAGKDVFVEWPLGKNYAEAKAIAGAAQKRGLRTMIGLQSWHVPAFAKAKEWIASNKIGRVISTSWVGIKTPEVKFNGPFVAPDLLFGRDPEKGATYLDIPIAHNLSAITRTLGKLSKVSATIVVGFKEVKIGENIDSEDFRVVPNDLPDQWSVSGVFESGALFSGTWLSAGKRLPPNQPALAWEIVGTEGKIRVESDVGLTATVPALFPPTAVFLNDERVDLAEENSAQTPTGRAWEAYVSGKKGSYPTFEDAMEIHRLVEAIRKSDKEGRCVRVDEVN